MNVLVIGQGGREHSIVQKLALSSQVETIFAAPGNGGMTEAELVSISETDHDSLIAFVKEANIGWTIVGPEVPLLEGVVNSFREEGLNIFGPTKEAALIEGSKAYAKEVMAANGIPTGDHQVFSSMEEALRFIERAEFPIVIKANGLAAGKGVVIAQDQQEADQAIREMLGGERFGEAGETIVVEEFLEGDEFSLMAFVHGTNVYPLLPAQDYKRAFDDDQGPNTGGMGAYAPSENIPRSEVDRAVETILKPTAEALDQAGRPFTGILYAGCILTNEGAKVIEFNARFGDPETQVVLPLLENDLMQVIEDIADGRDPQLKWKQASCAGVVVASKGYPGPYEKGHPLPSMEENARTFSVYAGVKKDQDYLVSAGGRVLFVGAIGSGVDEAIEDVYRALHAAPNPNFFFRTDIARQRSTSFSSEYK
ncbi:MULTISPECIES: phosphoribosylamine--glycine ligase [Pontibacillus]|uniref:Phosphoribosylamine--glycine ligase n=1 Tax=Pontibacillus chungwhensis TaxID=265426 RepID=A0ABY8UY82_9BACI|nr:MULTISPECIES: phosphoribosylamine--glycine ligase [Pontibacillus]MCD5325349.1 phosphoribosylamine--glycine ligase [Pontibacillus sp. HN14]WIF98467.1 phosphoribosylamine--glycine ligase [Pontibacillus chungwhensis]